MLTDFQLRSKIDCLWDKLWSGVLEQAAERQVAALGNTLADMPAKT